MAAKLVYTVGAISSSIAVGWALKSTLNKNEVIDAQCATPKDSSIQESLATPLGLDEAVNKARDLVRRAKDEVGAPGIVVGVSIDGKVVWEEGLGFSDVEKRCPCHAGTVMRIASISKSMTMAMVARLWEEGKLDLDAPVQKYAPAFPLKYYNGKQVDVTTRQLVSHLSGIRHYVKKGEKAEGELTPPTSDTRLPPSTRQKEVYNQAKFETVDQALALFKEDELMSPPGTQYLYTTHGWTLVSAVVEGAGKEKFTTQARRLFVQLGLENTRLDEHEPIIYNRASYYRTTSSGRLVNVPFTDNSYKWAGGGFLSTVGDLLQFANCMLYSYQWKPKTTETEDLPQGYLKPETMKQLWSPVPLTKGVANGLKYRDDGYGMGWMVAPYRAEYGTTGGGDIQLFHATHSGAAVGASSVLFILPVPEEDLTKQNPPKGICVAMLTNMQNVSLSGVADKVAHLFAKLN